ncbi:hypothetical protein BV25DRAFT_1820728 [Artomyces pyxidatus]|uniref:Uncharacterized protein n=1 Tax=Artomyces pyxidatus TaxID=48021 RepID=A0ACB8TE19_9AGAM|nr:hypothetical protein BV25DRAFT_1820728 [Artomyces pyxidatus]
MELREHTSVLRPFLRSFLSPFTWMFESRALSRLLQCTQAKDSYKWLIELAIDANKRGIAELASANRANAMHAYTEAIQHIHFAGLVALEEKQKEAVKTLYSVCLANRACALLQSGEKMDACFALLDAEASEVLSPGFSKAYHCQWKAHEILGNVYASQDVTERALKNIGLGHWRQLRNDWSHRRDIASRKRTASTRPE